jgi:hypothetical protein
MPDYVDLDPAFLPILNHCRSATMTSVERLYALYKAIGYLTAAGIVGDVVECGVWRGGSMMCAALSLLQNNDSGRQLYLYDTFAGMAAPDPVDVDLGGRPATGLLASEPRTENSHIWAYAPLETVQRNIASTGYPDHRATYVRGAVEETIPGIVPDAIALLRLDTDWHASTHHELRHLFPRLVKGGVLIIDDYGHWRGARQAVDEYFAASEVKILLNRVDYTGRIGVRV